MSRTAVIDLGTNTFNLLIADPTSGGFEAVHRGREIVKLGEGGIDRHQIAEPAFQRGLTAIRRHLETIRKFDTNNVVAVATSGIRSTSNGAEFVQALADQFDLQVQVIDGDREAELIWKGTVQACQITEPSLIMDIGGGSTEFILCDAEQINWKASFKLGASRLKEIFKPQDPISEGDIQALFEYFAKTMAPLKEAIASHKPKRLIGCSGSFDTFAEMMLHRQDRIDQFEAVDSMDLDLQEFDTSYSFLIGSTYEQRLNTPGIIPLRADMIVLSGLLTRFVLDLFDVDSLTVSKFALKEGLMAEALTKV